MGNTNSTLIPKLNFKCTGTKDPSLRFKDEEELVGIGFDLEEAWETGAFEIKAEMMHSQSQPKRPYRLINAVDWNPRKEHESILKRVINANLTSCTVHEMIKYRQEARWRKARGEIDTKLKAMTKRPLHAPLYPFRPYGLSEEMEGHRSHVWDMIFDHVYDPDTIEGLREVCTMFRDLLRRKHMAATMPAVISLCLETKAIPWEFDKTKGCTWVEALTKLRTISKATKNSVDDEFDQGILGLEGDEWFTVYRPFYMSKWWKIPTLELGFSNVEQVRLQKTLQRLDDPETSLDNFRMKALVFDEFQIDLQDDDRLGIRNAFGKCVQLIGFKITSFCYMATGRALDVYNNLSMWLPHLPNLEELIVGFIGMEWNGNEVPPENVGPFPTCPKLTRYVESELGLGFPLTCKILEANPTLTEILVKNIHRHFKLELCTLHEVLNILQLTKLHCLFTPSLSFFEFRFDWALKLTTLALWDTFDSKKYNMTYPYHRDIPSHKLFAFISTCKNVKTLMVSLCGICDTGGLLFLPNLEDVTWKMFPYFKNLGFLIPLESMKLLALDLRNCSGDFGEKEEVMEYLREYQIPQLFPALKKIQGTFHVRYEDFWKSPDQLM